MRSLSILEEQPLTLFFNAIKNDSTRRHYSSRLAEFFMYLKLNGSLEQQAKAFAKYAKKRPRETELHISSYLHHQKKRAERKEISESTLPNFWKPITLFCEQNDILLNWKKIKRGIPRGRQAAHDRPPTLDEITRLLAYPDRRIKVIILIMLSCGCRVEAFQYLNWGHIEPMEKSGVIMAARITIYAGQDEQYNTFITPECYRAVKEYMDFRALHSEQITTDSPLLRDLFEPDKGGRGRPKNPKRFGYNAVRNLVYAALISTGIRKPLPKGGKKRHEFQADHGFRKFFKTVCEDHMKTLHVEMLLGHDTGLNESYYKPREDKLLKAYLRAVPGLTILEKPPTIAKEDAKHLPQGTAQLVADIATTLRDLALEFKNDPKDMDSERRREVFWKRIAGFADKFPEVKNYSR